MENRNNGFREVRYFFKKREGSTKRDVYATVDRNHYAVKFFHKRF